MAHQDSYEKLRAKWYAKLKREGFNDIEDSEGRIKEWSSTLIGNKDKVHTQYGGWQAKEEYYRLATHFLNEYRFRKPFDKIIWEYHSNGISFKDIAATLNKTKVIRTNYNYIWKIVKRLRTSMYKKYSVRGKK